LVYKVKRYF